MITSNAEQIAKELKQYHADVVRRLEAMVIGVATEAHQILSESSPLGDSIVYKSWYERRQLQYGWKPFEGMTQGGWKFSYSNIPIFQEVHSTEESSMIFKQDISDYRLGKVFYIGNAVPYAPYLNQSVRYFGFYEKAVDKVLGIYMINAEKYYKQGIA